MKYDKLIQANPNAWRSSRALCHFVQLTCALGEWAGMGNIQRSKLCRACAGSTTGAQLSILDEMQCPAGFSGRVAPDTLTERCTLWSSQRRSYRQERRFQRLVRALDQRADSLPQAGPPDSPPSYLSIDSQPVNKAIMSLFRRKMVAAIGSDSHAEG